MPKRELFDATFTLISETEKAIKVTEGTVRDAVWLPKSQIEYEIRGDLIEVTMPIWLAREKGLAGA